MPRQGGPEGRGARSTSRLRGRGGRSRTGCWEQPDEERRSPLRWPRSKGRTHSAQWGADRTGAAAPAHPVPRDPAHRRTHRRRGRHEHGRHRLRRGPLGFGRRRQRRHEHHPGRRELDLRRHGLALWCRRPAPTPPAPIRASPPTRSPSATATTPASRQSPGLNQEMSDAIKAMIAWCNEQGGINGRTVKGNYYDAKILDVNNAMTDGVRGQQLLPRRSGLVARLRRRKPPASAVASRRCRPTP